MEGIHGVDTSWLHHSKGQRAPPAIHQLKPSSPPPPSPLPDHEKSQSSLGVKNARPVSAGSDTSLQNSTNGMDTSGAKTNGQSLKQQQQEPQLPHTERPQQPARKPSDKAGVEQGAQRKGGSKDGKAPPSPGLGRKSSWMSSLTSKFSTTTPSSQPAQSAPTATTNGQQSAQPRSASPGPAPKNDAPALASSPKSGSGFLSNAFRRFSSSSGAQMGKAVPNGGICPRRVLNVDPHRERCEIPDLKPAKLRRVAFCVDVEIAAAPKYKEESSEDLPIPMDLTTSRRRSSSASERDKKSKAKNKERSEGEALKYPTAMVEKKEKRKKPHANSTGGDMFEVPDPEEGSSIPSLAPPQTQQSQLSQSPQSPQTSQTNKPKPNVKSPPIHHDFGPNGMFEVDSWEQLPTPKPTPQQERASTGGAVHHDFGRHGMFEIPSSSEDEASQPKRSQPDSMSPENPPQSVSQDQSPVHNGTSQKALPANSGLRDEPTGAQVAKNTHVPSAQDPESTRTPETVSSSAENQQGPVSEHPDNPAAGPPATTPQPKESSRKKEKKKRSEEERKERKEKKRQAAIANGTLPVELTGSESGPQPSNKPLGKPQSRPTTDPLRIYRRCCQLREATPLPRVVEQLSHANACDPLHPSVVLALDLSNETIEFQDINTLGDWLAVVPVQKLLLENCGLTDEAARVVLAGLLAAKTSEQTKHNKHLARKPNRGAKEKHGVISKLSLKNNPLIGKHGWMHIAFFLNMSKSLQAIDLSLIPFPRPSPTSEKALISDDSGGSRSSSLDATPVDPMDIFWRSIAERHGGQHIEEVVMGDCNLSGDHVEKLVDAVLACKVSRLGLAHNNLDTKAYQAITRYINSPCSLELDLGGNKFSNHDDLQIIVNAIDYPDNMLFGVSFANCELTPSDAKFILPVLARLPDFRYIDFSHNRKLFETSPNVLRTFSKWLPQMKRLKRIGLNDVGLHPEHAIALAEILPEIPVLAHLSMQENPALQALADAKDEVSQEEACALYASLMAATRVSKTIVCIDIDVPSRENSEVVKALAKQVVAYSLRNMERSEHYKAAAAAITEPHGGEQAVAVPDVLLHLVGHVDAADVDDDGAAPDEDYLVGGTGVVKALSVVLGQNSKRMSRDGTPVASGANTPRLSAQDSKKGARDMSKNLLESARKIRHRLQPALLRAKADGPEELNSKRLGYLDHTLERMIQRFEDEFPECKADIDLLSVGAASTVTPGSSYSSFKDPFSAIDETIENEVDPEDNFALGSLRRASRHGSDVSLASRHLVNEEGRIHRFGQRMRREVMPPTYTVDHHWGTTGEGHEEPHIQQLRVQLESMNSDQIRAAVEEKGFEQVVAELKLTAKGLKELEQKDPETWAKCRDAGMCAKLIQDDLAQGVPKEESKNEEEAHDSGKDTGETDLIVRDNLMRAV